VVAVAASYNSGTETPEELVEELISLRLPEVNHLHTIRYQIIRSTREGRL